MTTQLVLLIIVISIVTILATRAAGSAKNALDDAGSFLPDVPTPVSNSPSGNLLTMQGNTPVFHAERLPPGTWHVRLTMQTPARTVLILNEEIHDETLEARRLPQAKPEGYLTTYTITVKRVNGGSPVTHTEEYAYVNPSLLVREGMPLSQFHARISRLPTRLIPRVLSSCTLDTKPLRMMTRGTRVQQTFCGLPGGSDGSSASECVHATSPDECEACLGGIVKRSDAYFLALLSTLLPEHVDTLPEGHPLKECFSEQEWGILTDVISQPVKEDPSFDPTRCVRNNPRLTDYLAAFKCAAVDKEGWQNTLRSVYADATLGSIFACDNPKGRDEPSLTSPVWEPRILTLPITCQGEPFFTKLSS